MGRNLTTILSVLPVMLHEGSHWLVGRLLGLKVRDYGYVGNDRIPFMIVWDRNPPWWKRILVDAAPMLMLPLWLLDIYTSLEFDELW